MKKLTRLSIVCPLVFILLQSFGILHAESTDSKEASSPLDVGLIFNIDGINLDFESYQGGIGVKLGNDSLAFRVLLDLYYSKTNDKTSFTIDAGTSFEYHLVKGPLSPYFGAFLSLGYDTLDNKISGLFYRKFPITVGPLFGIEFFPAEFLSFFIEYAVEFQYNLITIETSVSGSVTRERADEFSINTGLGNNARIGIIIYFIR